MAKAERSPPRCRVLCLKPAVAANAIHGLHGQGVPAPGKVSGNIAASFPANRRRASTGGARGATIISMSASRNGGRAHGVAVAGPLAVDGVCLKAGARKQAGARLGGDVRAGRTIGPGGERVGIPGLLNPSASRNIIDKMAQAMLHDDAARLSLPPSFVPSALAEIVVLSDFWSPISEIRTMLAGLSASGAHGTLIQIVDPAEESFPYSGPCRVRRAGRRRRHHRGPCRSMGRRLRGARRASPRPIRAETDKLDWLFSTHTTNRSAAELLLFLHSGMMVGKGSARTACPVVPPNADGSSSR